MNIDGDAPRINVDTRAAGSTPNNLAWIDQRANPLNRPSAALLAELVGDALDQINQGLDDLRHLSRALAAGGAAPAAKLAAAEQQLRGSPALHVLRWAAQRPELPNGRPLRVVRRERS